MYELVLTWNAFLSPAKKKVITKHINRISGHTDLQILSTGALLTFSDKEKAVTAADSFYIVDFCNALVVDFDPVLSEEDQKKIDEVLREWK